MGIKEQLAQRLPFTKAGKELKQIKAEEEKERLRAKLMAESRKKIDGEIVSYSKLWNIGQELDENGSPTTKMRESVIAEAVKKSDDLVTINELKHGIEYDFWDNQQWGETLEEYLGNRSIGEIRRGLDTIFGRPGLTIKLVQLHMTSPYSLSPMLNMMTSSAINESKKGKSGGMGQVGELIASIASATEQPKTAKK